MGRRLPLCCDSTFPSSWMKRKTTDFGFVARILLLSSPTATQRTNNWSHFSKPLGIDIYWMDYCVLNFDKNLFISNSIILCTVISYCLPPAAGGIVRPPSRGICPEKCARRRNEESAQKMGWYRGFTHSLQDRWKAVQSSVVIICSCLLCCQQPCVNRQSLIIWFAKERKRKATSRTVAKEGRQEGTYLLDCLVKGTTRLIGSSIQ